MACTNHRRVGLEGASEAVVVETPKLDLFSEQYLFTLPKIFIRCLLYISTW